MEFRQQFRVKVTIALITAVSILTAVFGVLTNGGAPTAHAAQSVPYLINFQGRLTDNAGNALADGQYNVRFRIFDDPSAGTNEWQGDRIRGASDNRITVQNGLFNIQFGDATKGDPALSPSLFDTQTNPSLYLEVELPTPATASCATNGCAVWTEGAMTPRQPLASSPYAFNADRIDGIDGASLVQLSPGSTQTGNIDITGSVDAASLQVTGAVQGASATYTGASSLTLGTAGPAGNTGAILFQNASNSNTVTLQSGVSGSTFALTLPTALTTAGDCLKDTTGAGALGFASCSAGVTLQTVYDNSATPALITTSSGTKDIVIKSGSGFNSTTAFQVIPDGTATPTLNIDTQNNRVGIGVAAPTESLEVAGAIRVGTTTNSNAGTIRWNGTDFEGYDGAAWLALSNSGLVQTTPTVARRKTSLDTSLASTTTFTPEPDLSFDVGAGEDWAFRYFVQASVAAAPDIKFRINAPAGATCVWAVNNYEDAVSASNNNCNVSVTQTIATAGPLNDGLELVGTITNPTTAGTVSLDWAPNASSATATIFRRGSSLMAVRASGTNTPFEAFVNGGNTFSGTAQLGTNNAQDLVLLTNGTEKLRVDTNGNLKLAATPTASATASLLEMDAAIAGGSASGTFIGANPAAFTGDFVNLQVNGATKLKVNNFGDQTSGFTQLDGSTTTNGTGTNSTSMTVVAGAAFDIGNYIQLANTAACTAGGPTTCYAKITNKVGNVLTISPALTWATARPVVEYHVPEIGGNDVAVPALNNRYGRGYFIAGVATGNGTTYYNEDGIESSATDFNLLTSNVTNLAIGSSGTTVAVPGSLTVAGQSIVNGSGEINGAQLQAGTVANGALANDTVTVTAGTGLSGGGGVALGGSTSISVVYGSTSTSAVRGDTTVVCPSGSGNLSGTGNTITLGSGGTCNGLTTVNNPTFSTSVTTPSLGATGALNIASGGSSNLTLNSLGGTLVLGTNTTTIQKAANALTIDLATAATSTLNILNSNGSNVTNLSIDGGLSAGGTISAPTATNTINGLVINTGTISTGAWQGTAVGAQYGGTGQTTYAVGDLLTANTTTSLTRIAAVASGSCLISQGTNTQPIWGACAAGSATTTLNNLGTTSINADLLPSANNTRSIGSASLVWQNMYAGNIDAGTTTTALTIGTAATTTAITLGRAGLAVSVPGGLTAPALSGTGALNIASGGAGVLSLNSASGTITLGAATTTIQKAAAALTLDLATAATSTLTIGNSNGANVANISLDGGISAGGNISTSGNISTTGTGAITSAGAISAPTTVNSINGLIINAGALSGATGLTLTSGNITTPGNISTTGTGTITSAGAISAPTATNTINGAIINSGALSAITGIAVSSGNVTFNQAAGNQFLVTTNAVAPTVDQISVTNAGATGVTAAGVNALAVNFRGGAAAVESAAIQIDLQPGTTTGGTWSGVNFTHNATGPATGVTSNGAKFTGPTAGGAGTYNALNIAGGATTTGGTSRAINITAANGQTAGAVQGININTITAGAATETAIAVGQNWDSIISYNGTAIINGTGLLQSASLSGTYSNAVTLNSASNAFTGNGSGVTNLNPSNLVTGTAAVTLASAAATNVNITPGTSGQVIIGGTTPTVTSTGTLAIDSNTTNALNIGTALNAKNISIGNATGATNLTLRGGTGGINLTPVTNSTTAFSIQDSAAVRFLTINTTSATPRLHVGPIAADGTGILLVLDVKNTTTDPTGTDGAMYYNSATGDFRCYTAGDWKNCDRPTLRQGWFMYEDWMSGTITAGTGADLGNIGENNWTFVSIGVGGNIAKNDVGAAASDQGRNGVIRLNSPATVTTGVSLRTDNTSINGVPGDMTVEWDLATVTDNIQQTIRIGLHDSVTNASPTDGIYFQYNVTTTAANWFRCTRNNGAETCTDTGIAKAAINTYQRFRISTNTAGTQVDFFINEVSAGSNTTNLPAAARSYGPTINTNTVTATIRQWKMDYFQLRRTNATR